MALTAYISALQTLLHDQAGQFYPTSTLTGFINEARQQVAAESSSIVGLGSFTTVPNQTLYQNSVVTPPAVPAGVAGLITPNSLSFNPQFASGGNIVLTKRNWEWFNFYILGFAAKPAGFPYVWCPFQQGAATLPQGGASAGAIGGGSFYISNPSMALTVNVDGIWYPINLATDSDPEAIPGPFNDAVPLYGQYLAYLDARNAQLAQDALQLYELFMGRARAGVTPLADQQAYPGDLNARKLPGQAPALWGAQGATTGRGTGQ